MSEAVLVLFDVAGVEIERRQRRLLISQRIVNIPHGRTSFVGREPELRQLDDLFGSGKRLVTVLGAPGMGKTRLAACYGSKCLQQESHTFSAAWFCDLTEARSVDGIVSSVAAALDVPLLEGRTTDATVTQLAHALVGRGCVLLILDNFEQVVEHAAKTIGTWLDAAPDVGFLVTSRERLRLGGENCLELGPLSAAEAADLFFERARQRCVDFDANAKELNTVTDLVTRLDYIPLAIELAAARVAIMPPAKLLSRLAQRFEVLRGARRDVCSRQNSLENAIDWSWNLLTDWEQAGLAQFSVFCGGCSLEAAEAIIDLSAYPRAPLVVEVAESLVDKSLLRTKTVDTDVRFCFFESIREYSAMKLDRSGDLPGTEQRHAGYYLAQGQRWKDGFDGPHIARCRRYLSREADNLFEIHRRFLHSDPEKAVRAVLLLDAALSGRQSLEQRHALFTSTIEVAESFVEPQLKARLRLAVGEVRRELGMGETADADFRSVIEWARNIQSPTLESQAFFQLGLLSRGLGNLEPAERSLTLALELARKANRLSLESTILTRLGNVELFRSTEEALAHFEAALAIAKRIGSPKHRCMSLLGLGLAVYLQGGLRKAEKLVQQAKKAAEAADDHYGHGAAAVLLATILFDRGHLDEAEHLFSGVVSTSQLVGNRRLEVWGSCSIGVLQHERGQIEEALKTLEAVRALVCEINDQLMEGVVHGHIGRIAQERRDFQTARTEMNRALERCREHGSRRDEVRVLANLGILEIELGEFGKARSLLAQASALAEQLEEAETRGLALAFLAAAEIFSNQPDNATVTFDEARAILTPRGYVGLIGTLDLLEGLFDVAKARGSRPAGPDGHLAAARQRLLQGSSRKPADRDHPHGVPAATEISFHARVAHQLLKSSIAQVDPERVAGIPDKLRLDAQQEKVKTEPTDWLLVHPEGHWFQVSAGARVDLSRSHTTRLLLIKLVEHRTNHPGQGLTVYDMMEVGWPNQTMSMESGASRVYVLIGKLRKLGLESLILTQETGYLLDPNVTVVWGDPDD